MDRRKNAADASSAKKLLSESQLLKLATEIFEERKRSELERQDNDDDTIKKEKPVPLDNFEEDNDGFVGGGGGTSSCHLVKSCAICILTIVVAFSIFAYVIFVASKSSSSDRDESAELPPTRESNQGGNIEVCGADSFMIRDGVCDEATNTEKCHWDGGDCCQDKFLADESLCKDCQCRWNVNKEELQALFNISRVAMLSEPDTDFIPVHIEKIVEDVASKNVCDAICTLDELDNVVNAWVFSYETWDCTCAWLTSMTCDWKTADKSTGATVAQLQLAKVLPCDCQRLHHRLPIEDFDPAIMLDSTTTLSSWHCHKGCQFNQHCTRFTWDLESQDCILVAADVGIHGRGAIAPSPGSVAGVADCDTIDNSLDQGLSDKLLVVGGWDSSDSPLKATEAFDLDRPYMSCHHGNYYDLPVPLWYATGSVIQSSSVAYPLAIICGGMDNNFNEHGYCYNLGSQVPLGALLSAPKHAMASVPIIDDKTLWVTGGASANIIQSSTDYISLSDSGPGQDLDFPVMGHCMLNLDDKDLLLIGGIDRGDLVMFKRETMQYNFASSTWKQTQASLTLGRAQFACGIVYDSDPELSSTFYLVAAGGCVQLNADRNCIPQQTDDNLFTLSTEVMEMVDQEIYFDMLGRSWSHGPSFPYEAAGVASITTSDKKALITAGGIRGDGVLMSDIFRLQCSSGNCQWSQFPQSLPQPRSHAVAMILPTSDGDAIAGKFQCLDLSKCHGHHGHVYDGRCHGSLNIAECAFDGGDCCQPQSNSTNCNDCSGDECLCHKTMLGSCIETCLETENDAFLGDGHCDLELNIEGCEFDRGDCCLPAETTNGMCNGQNNNAACDYNKGDCCLEETECQNCIGTDCVCHETGGVHCNENIDLANCPESLNYDYVNDGYCDGTHNIAECGYDGGDCCHAEGTQICYYCEGDDCICHYTATTHCKLITEACLEEPLDIEEIGDEVCHEGYNIHECNFDGGDCCLEDQLCFHCDGDGCLCHETGVDHCADIADCPKDVQYLINNFNDDFCNAQLNNAECDYDGGDCCDSYYINKCCKGDECLCLEIGDIHCPGIDCRNADNGICNGDINNEECNFDRGDCCLEDTDCQNCTNDTCNCHVSGKTYCAWDLTQCPESLYHHYVEDGYCDGSLNIAECAYDGGDCCPSEGIHHCHFCDGNSCTCHETGLVHCTEFCLEEASAELIGNGQCHDFLNDLECDFDGGDCCLEEADCENCQGEGCFCHETGMHNCPEDRVLCGYGDIYYQGDNLGETVEDTEIACQARCQEMAGCNFYMFHQHNVPENPNPDYEGKCIKMSVYHKIMTWSGVGLTSGPAFCK